MLTQRKAVSASINLQLQTFLYFDEVPNATLASSLAFYPDVTPSISAPSCGAALIRLFCHASCFKLASVAPASSQNLPHFSTSRGVLHVLPFQQIHIGGLFGLDKGKPIKPNLLSPPLRKLTAWSHPSGADRLDTGEVTTGRGDSQDGVKMGLKGGS